jgi:hypothetical protein
MGKSKRNTTYTLDLPVLSYAHFQDRIIMGAERKTHYIDPKDKLMTAYHEVLRVTSF